MRARLRTTTVALLGTLVVSAGCATKAQLRRGLAEQRSALDAERTERIAADQRLAGDVAGLRTDLASLQTDFGAKIAALEAGMQIAMPVHFPFGKAEIDAGMQPVLDRFLQVVQRHYPSSMITVEGFADPAGPVAFNRRLSQKRAEAVRRYLAERGLPDTQLRAVGYGEARPVVPGAAGTEHGADLNRRVVFVVETPAGTPTVAATPTAERTAQAPKR